MIMLKLVCYKFSNLHYIQRNTSALNTLYSTLINYVFSNTYDIIANVCIKGSAVLKGTQFAVCEKICEKINKRSVPSFPFSDFLVLLESFEQHFSFCFRTTLRTLLEQLSNSQLYSLLLHLKLFFILKL